MDDRIARTPGHFTGSLLLGLLLTGCGGGGDSPAPAWTIGGTVTGLTGSGLVLRNNGGNDLTVPASGSFTFAAGVPNGTPYAVTVQAQPTNPPQTCSVTSGSGTATANVSSVAINCVTDTYTVGGLVSGLLGSGLVLRNNGGNDLAVTTDGAFTFSAAVVSGTPFAVSVRTQPSNPSQTCTVNGGSGTRASAVTNVSIECVVNSFTVGGGLSNLRGTGLALQVNGGEIVSPTGSNFVFPTAIPSGRAYSVVVTSQPTNPHQTCSANAASGTVTNANVTSISIACVTNTYTVSGTVSGVLGSGLVLRNNAGNPVVVTGDGPFTFPDRSASGDGYFVSAFSHPTNPAQECAIVDGRGPVISSPITGVRVICYLVGRWMFVTRQSGATLSVAAIDQTSGVLTSAPGSPYTVNSPGGSSATPDGRFLYVPNIDNRTITGYAINRATGVLTLAPNSPFAAGLPIDPPTIDPSGRFLYATDQENARVFGYRIDGSTGELTPIAGSPFALGARSLALRVDSTGRFAYVLSKTAAPADALALHSFSIDATTGALTELAGSPLSAGTGLPGPNSLALAPDDQSLYFASGTGNLLRAYRLDTSLGTPTEMAGSPFVVASGSTRPVPTPRVPALYVGGNAGVAAWLRGSTLTGVPGSPYAVPGNSSSLAFDPSARYLYAWSSPGGVSTLTMFDILAGGVLQPKSTLTTTFALGNLTSDPSGRFLFGADPDTGAVTAITVQSVNGSLNIVTGGSFNAGVGAGRITITK